MLGGVSGFCKMREPQKHPLRSSFARFPNTIRAFPFWALMDEFRFAPHAETCRFLRIPLRIYTNKRFWFQPWSHFVVRGADFATIHIIHGNTPSKASWLYTSPLWFSHRADEKPPSKSQAPCFCFPFPPQAPVVSRPPSIPQHPPAQPDPIRLRSQGAQHRHGGHHALQQQPKGLQAP